MPMLPEEDYGAEPPDAEDPLDWQPHVHREQDPRQPSLPL
jgi:hypothetical protein